MADDGVKRGISGQFQSRRKKIKRGNSLRQFHKDLKKELHEIDHNYDSNLVIFDETELGATAEQVDVDNKSLSSSWGAGRRIVELGFLADKMFCVNCNCPLHLKDTVGERIGGCGSTLFISCTNPLCLSVNDVPTGKMNSSGAFDITDKIIIGAIHAGLGYTHVTNFMAALNLPVMSKSCFQRHEKKMGKVITEVAEESCSRARELEKELSEDQGLEVGFDAGWQKRGSGFNYNSMTGHAAMIGAKSHKVTCFEVRSRCCKLCEHYENKDLPVPGHDCQKNWYGSSKSMEPDLAVSLAHTMQDNGCPIDVIHADNDSTTMVKLKVDFPDIVKKDDQNHITKGITKNLIELSKRHKPLKPAEVIPYLNRCFMYAVTQNQDDDKEIDKALARIVPHVYGDHSLCEDVEWCTYKNDPVSFKYKSLPGGNSLKNQHLRTDLEELIQKYRTKTESLKNLGSTQANESFNNSVAVHAPKNRHYGGSQSLKSRVSSAVLQKK